MAKLLLESLRMKETVVGASEVRRLRGRDLSWFLLFERWVDKGGWQAGVGLGGGAFWANGSVVAFPYGERLELTLIGSTPSRGLIA
jgi:hypothetical protein